MAWETFFQLNFHVNTHTCSFAVCLFIGSNLLTIKDEAENSFLLEELSAFGSSVQMVWLNAQFDSK